MIYRKKEKMKKRKKERREKKEKDALSIKNGGPTPSFCDAIKTTSK